MQIADSKIIPAKAGAGEADLQARYIRFDNYTFLKQAAEAQRLPGRSLEGRHRRPSGALPQYEHQRPGWRKLFRDVRLRRALSLAIDRDEINQVIYYGLAQPANNTVLPRKPAVQAGIPEGLDRLRHGPGQPPAGRDRPDQARSENVRLLPDGRPMEIIVETAGESTEEVDVLELIADSWRKIGVKLFTKPSQLEVLRNRIYCRPDHDGDRQGRG